LRFHVRIVAQSMMHNAAVIRTHRLQFHDVAPAADFIGGVLGLFHERFARLRAVAAHVEHDFRRGLVLLEQNAVHDVLQIAERLALAANEPAGFFRFHIERQVAVEHVFLDRRGEAKCAEDFFQDFFRLRGHKN
jgi:hypothetical protein